ncbi:glycoside hydrolase family 47 protein [Aspergillus affinis]|uniref:glycoside hydrolase family 47 protein n=1 Tax=Aspergillus affinis TaxID=1070780 RepID=UPI0022FDD588|nr:seven-hairpin glycosidase [Aspergillus affinis]KAI9037907.1 seven-hairpin glycosidase [Aspergillus affinis]
MVLGRRSYIVPTFFLIAFTYVFISSLPQREHSIHSHNPPQTPPKSLKEDGRIHWTKQPEKWPVSEYMPLPTGAPSPIPQIQHNFPKESWFGRWKRVKRQNAVKEAFKHAWKGYREHAWLRDEVSPLSGNFRETFAGWGATLVDSLDSLVILGMQHEFEEALEALDHIDFTTTHAVQINVFETNIRYLGGFLGAYDLTNGSYPILLKKAIEVAELLYGSFDTRYRIPQSRWEWTRSAEGMGIHPSRNTITAEIGSLNLEFTRVSQLTGDSKYYDAAQRLTNILEETQARTKLPGLWPITFNGEDMIFSDNRFSVGAMADSTYEYLPKAHMLLGAQTTQFRKMYNTAMNKIKERLLFRGMTEDGKDILFPGNVYTTFSHSREKIEPQVEHLKCYLGGTVGIGAKVFARPEDLDIARKLTDGCIWGYDVMPSGIMPEIMYVSPCQDMNNCQWDKKQWYRDLRFRLAKGSEAEDTVAEAKSLIESHGLQPGIYAIPDAGYQLRPEAIESVFIMYRITGDKSLQDAAWRMFKSIDKMTRAQYGHAAIDDVRDPNAKQMDYMESFWLAETLKYFYLIFSEPDVVSLDEYVFNTEAHPFKRPTPPA